MKQTADTSVAEPVAPQDLPKEARPDGDDQALINQIFGDTPMETPINEETMTSSVRTAPDTGDADTSEPPVDSSEPVDVQDAGPAEDSGLPDDILSSDSIEFNPTVSDSSESDPAEPVQEEALDLDAAEREDEEVSSNLKLDEKQKHAFSELAFQKRELRRENAELKEKLKAFDEGAAQVEPAALEEKDRVIEELEEKIGKLDLAQSPQFQKQFDSPIRERLSRAENLLIRSGVDQTEARVLVLQALNIPDLNERISFLSTEAPTLQGPLINLYEEVDHLKLEREKALTRWKETRAADKEREKREDIQVQWKAMDSLVDSTLTGLREGGDFLFAKSKKDEAWNGEVDDRVAAFKGVLQKNDPAELATYIARGVSFPKLLHLFRSERQRRNSLEKQLKSRFDRQPSFSGDRSPNSSPAVKPDSRTDEQIMSDIWKA